MKVLVTGGMGYIGSHTCIALCEAGITPVIYDNLSNSNIKVLEQLKTITGHEIPFIEGDVNDRALFSAILTEHNIEAIFHFAALKAVGESVEKPIQYYQNNVSGTLDMLSAMKDADVNRIVFSSSATVYGDPTYLPIDEKHPISATNPYGWTKVMVEQILQDVCSANSSLLTIALRYFNPVGAHPSGLLGESPNGIPNNLMPFISQTAVGKREFISVFGHDYDTPDGTGVRDYIHIMDLAIGHVAAFLTHEQDNGFHAYNLGTGAGYSVIDVIHSFEKSSSRPIPYKFSPRRAGDIACNYADASLAKEKLNWTAKRDLQSMTDDTWNWQSKYPNGME